MLYLRLFYEFFKTGLFAVGGGLATIPFLQDIGVKTGWFTQQELANMIAVAESTPGPMGVNMATYVGFTSGGLLGSLVATLGLITPSIILILIIAVFLSKFRQNKYVESVFYGLRPASTGLIAAAGWSVVWISMLTGTYSVGLSGIDFQINLRWSCLGLAAVIWLLTHWSRTKKLHPVIWIALSAVVGIVLGL